MKKIRIVLSVILFIFSIGIGMTVAEKRIRSTSEHTSCGCHSIESIDRQTRTVEPSVLMPEQTCGCF